MKRNPLRGLVLAFVGVLALTAPALAAWNYESVMWQRSNNATGTKGGVYGIPPRVPFDTLYVTGAAARIDTTAAWNMLDSEPSPTGTISIGGATADSSQVGAFIIAADSSVASTLAWAATTVQFQVNYGLNASGWTSVGSTISPLGTTTQKALIFPMWNLPVATAHLGSTSFNATYNIFAPQVRAIVTWGAAAAAPQSRAFVRKWLGTGVVQVPNSARQVAP